MAQKKSRRRFLRTAAVTGGAASSGLAGIKKAQAKSKRIPTVELLKIGVVGVGEYSHMPTIWGPTIQPDVPDRWPIRTTRMLMTHVWDSRPEKAEEFAKKFKCEVVKNYYDMVDKVDGMIFGSFYEVKWWHLLTKPYLEAGIPCFINRPFSASMKHAREIVEIARRHNTPILCTDEREYIKEVTVARWKVEELLKGGKKILGVNSDNSANEYPAHGVHGLYFLLAILGMDVEQASLQANHYWSDNKKWMLLSLQYRGIKIEGAGEQTKPFVAAQQQIAGHQANAGIRIYYNGGWWDTMNHWTKGESLNRLYYFFFPTVFAMQRMFETRKMQWSYDYILKKTKIYLAAFKSYADHNGAMFRVDDLPDDWEAPWPKPDWIDESIFK
ncbi:MAG: Gfo/Idh/MocA family oxidoreductase [Candidatus Latescibacteria bacterium]|nr:Gfo/Idh/MocA family oxidoreductase [Candidatus Latescibacterota bacterium]